MLNKGGIVKTKYQIKLEWYEYVTGAQVHTNWIQGYCYILPEVQESFVIMVQSRNKIYAVNMGKILEIDMWGSQLIMLRTADGVYDMSITKIEPVYGDNVLDFTLARRRKLHKDAMRRGAIPLDPQGPPPPKPPKYQLPIEQLDLTTFFHKVKKGEIHV